MGKLKEITAGWNKVQEDVKDSLQSEATLWTKIKHVVWILARARSGRRAR